MFAMQTSKYGRSDLITSPITISSFFWYGLPHVYTSVQLFTIRIRNCNKVSERLTATYVTWYALYPN